MVAIREPREAVLHAVRRDYGVRFEYWRLPPPQLPPLPEGTRVIIADDELLPERHGRKVRVPLNSNGSMHVLTTAPGAPHRCACRSIATAASSWAVEAVEAAAAAAEAAAEAAAAEAEAAAAFTCMGVLSRKWRLTPRSLPLMS